MRTSGNTLTRYDDAPLDASGWPVSGREAQDTLVTNLMNLEPYQVMATQPDYRSTFYISEALMNGSANIRGMPPMDSSNPSGLDRSIIGGVNPFGRSLSYELPDAIPQVTGDPNQPATNPEPPAGGGDVFGDNVPFDANEVRDGSLMDSGMGEAGMTLGGLGSGFWMLAVIVGIVVYFGLRHRSFEGVR